MTDKNKFISAATKYVVRHWKLLAVVLALFILVVATVTMPGQKHATVYSAIDKNAPADYSLLTPPQIRNRLLALTGIDITELAKKPLRPGNFKTFDQSYQVAQAFYGLHDYKNALTAYGIADAKPAAQKPYIFYERYAAVAAMDNKPELVKTLQDSEVMAIKSDTSLTGQVKQQKMQLITDQQRLKRYGY